MAVAETLAQFKETESGESFSLQNGKLLKVTPDLAKRHYAEHVHKPFYPGLVSFMTSGPVLALALRGKNAVAVVRKMLGATFCSKAESGTIRGDFGISDGFNLVHASDSPEAAKFELALFFRDGEILDYPMADTVWVYDTTSDLR